MTYGIRYPSNELVRRQHSAGYPQWGVIPARGVGRRAGGWSITLDVVDEDDAIVVEASLPGINPDDISVSIENDILTIRGDTGGQRGRSYLVRERRTGFFHRSLRLPDTLDVDKAQPRYDQGVLTIAFPKLATKQARQLTVTTGDGDQTIEAD